VYILTHVTHVTHFTLSWLGKRFHPPSLVSQVPYFLFFDLTHMTQTHLRPVWRRPSGFPRSCQMRRVVFLTATWPERLGGKIASIRSARDASVLAFNLHNPLVRRSHATFHPASLLDFVHVFLCPRRVLHLSSVEKSF